MKKIINGKMYNTSTAKQMGEWWNRNSGLDYIRETLFRKRTGEFFLHGEGGARTKYAKRTGSNFWEGSEEIMQLSWDEARDWAEEHLTADEYEEIFGEISEDETKQILTLSLSAASIERGRRAAAKAGINISAFIEMLLNNYQD